MTLSIVIVNYNVKYFLEQALLSVKNASKEIPAEIFVVDNNSVDGSVEMLKVKFPEVILIENKKNLGFSSANNQAIRKAKGKYILLLNPDTLVEEDTFLKTIAFMEAHPEAGGLGVKMIDGSGNFLPESKRGFPSPLVAFYKIFGFSALFPKSKIFGKYHLGYLLNNKVHEVDVLSGAFMMIRKEVLDKIGLLDESFFMYGEDIDLSYRIVKGGYKNFYFPETRIIHYKGESTKKSSINYVFVFYKAMVLFAQKHFSEKNARLFSILINSAVYFRAGIALFNRFLKRMLVPFADALILFSGIYLITNFWEENVMDLQYPPAFLLYVVPVYIITWVLTIYFSGGYDKPVNPSKIIRGLLSGTVFILVIYALLPESYRFSRAIILLSTIWSFVSLIFFRVLLNISGFKEFAFVNERIKRILITGKPEEANRVYSLLKQSAVPFNFIGFVLPEKEIEGNREGNYLGEIKNLDEIIEVYKIDEVIFCAKDVSANEIINNMSVFSKKEVEFKIAPPESMYIIGSNSINNNGELYMIDINSINKLSNKRNKRLIDILVCALLICLIPLAVFLIKRPVNFFKNLLMVFVGNNSWVGYAGIQQALKQMANLPKIKKGILSPLDAFNHKTLDELTIARLNMLYAKDYKVYTDINILIKGFRNLGR